MLSLASCGHRTHSNYTLATFEQNEKLTSYTNQDVMVFSDISETSVLKKLPSPWLRTGQVQQSNYKLFGEIVTKHITNIIEENTPKHSKCIKLGLIIPSTPPWELLQQIEKELYSQKDFSNISFLGTLSPSFSLLALYLLARSSEISNKGLEILHNVGLHESNLFNKHSKENKLLCIYEDADFQGNICSIFVYFHLKFNKHHYSVRLLSRHRKKMRLNKKTIQTSLKNYAKNSIVFVHHQDNFFEDQSLSSFFKDKKENFQKEIYILASGSLTWALGGLAWWQNEKLCTPWQINIQWSHQLAIQPIPVLSDDAIFPIEIKHDKNKYHQYLKAIETQFLGKRRLYPQGFRLLWNPTQGDAWTTVQNFLFSPDDLQSTPFIRSIAISALNMRNYIVSLQQFSKKEKEIIQQTLFEIQRTECSLPEPWRYP